MKLSIQTTPDNAYWHENALQHMITVCNTFAPDANAQVGFATIVADMQEAKEPYVAIVNALAHALTTGLEHGNWPI